MDKQVLYISDSAIPSASPNSVHVMKMAQAFGQLGWETTLWGKRTTACFKEVKDEFEFYAVEKNFRLSVFPNKAFPGSGRWYNLMLALRLPFVSAKQLIYTRAITAAYLLHLYRKPFVFEIHEPYETKTARLARMNKVILSSPYLKKLVVITQSLKDYYLQNSTLTEDRIFVGHDGADACPDVLAAALPPGFSIGYIGSLYEGKGMELIATLAPMAPHLQFHVVGGLPAQIAQWKGKTGPLDNLHFHGFKKQAELPAFLHAFDVLIAPYQQKVIVSEKASANNLAQWMSPLKLFEYMSAAKPIVVTKLPVIEEVIEQGVDGWLCESGKPQQWIDTLDWLRNHPAEAAAAGARAKQKFLHHYTWRRRVEQIVEALGKT